MDRAEIAAIIFDADYHIEPEPTPEETYQQRITTLAKEGFREV